MIHNDMRMEHGALTVSPDGVLEDLVVHLTSYFDETICLGDIEEGTLHLGSETEFLPQALSRF